MKVVGEAVLVDVIPQDEQALLQRPLVLHVTLAATRRGRGGGGAARGRALGRPCQGRRGGSGGRGGRGPAGRHHPLGAPPESRLYQKRRHKVINVELWTQDQNR